MKRKVRGGVPGQTAQKSGPLGSKIAEVGQIAGMNVIADQTRTAHAQRPEDALTALGVSADVGLSQAEAASRLPVHGPNLLSRRRQAVAFDILVHQFANPVVVLLAAAVSLAYGEIATAIGLPGADAGVIEGRELKPEAELSEAEKQSILATNVFARVSPAQKLELVSLHQARGEIVRNPYIWAALAGCTGLLLLAVYTPILAQTHHLVRLAPNAWALVIGLSFMPVVVVNIGKSFMVRW
ncbi:MAG TPA: cation-transporting P-type ATPase [Thermohalobaculum sp.]|nr:cation-transporting P-type ATPase [Thermohalobaculum sp.]